MEVVVTTVAIRCEKSSSEIVATNKPTTQLCLGWMPFLLPN